MGITVKGQDEVLRDMQQQIEKQNRKIDTALRYAGENGIITAKNTQTYQDRTGNLRSSLGYLVHAKGQTDDVEGMSGTSEGQQEGEKALHTVMAGLTSDHALVMVAGMPYAEAVERRGYDVLSNGALVAESVFKQLIR